MNTMGENESSEARRLLDAWNPPTPTYGSPMFVHRDFAEWARKQPEAPAIISEVETLSYAELDVRSNQLARHLQGLGAGPEIPVAICFERSVDLLVGLVGIAKSGGACVFLDPSYPPHRLTTMLREAGARLLVTRESTARAFPPHEAVVVAVDRDRSAIASQSDQPVSDGVDAGSLSCIFFTSGSTGIPKAVMWQYTRNVEAPVVQDKQRARSVTAKAGDRHLFKASVGFTLVSLEVHGPLRSGGTVVIIPPGQEQDPRFLVEQMRLHSVASIALVPTLLQLILEEPQLAQCQSLKEIFTFGEKLSPRLCQEVFARTNAQLTMVYGLTEAPSATSWTALDASSLRPAAVGFVNPSRRLYVLDADLKPLPQGVTGEIFVGGNISRGYAGRPAYTAERFLPDAFSPVPGARMYRSGDHGRFAADGMLEFVGRVDDQVKIRGFRVEIAEIETALAEHPLVRTAVVMAHDPNGDGPTLAAYYVVRDNNGALPDESELLRHLRARLPSFMVPSRVVRLETIPLNRNGKLDRAALPLPEAVAALGDAPIAVPGTPAEISLCQIWEEILARSPIGIHDDFFDLGGHSIHAARITARARREFNIDLSVTALFNYPTISALAAEIERAGSFTTAELFPPLVPTSSLHPEKPAVTSTMQRSAIKENESAIALGLPSDSALFHYGIKGSLQVPALEHALREILRRHHILRTVYQREGTHITQQVQPTESFKLERTEVGTPVEIHTRHASDYFDLCKDLPVRATLLRVGAKEHHLIFSLHHIVYDHVTTSSLLRELWTLYDAFARGQPSPLPEPTLQYADYAAWEASWLRRGTERYDALAAYWLKQLGDAPPSPEGLLAADVPIVHPSLEDSVHAIDLTAETTAALRRLAREEKATVFMVILTAVEAAFHLGGGFEDIILKTYVDSRTRPELTGTFGCFIRGMALRTRVSPDLTFVQLLQRVRTTCLEGFTHLDLPSDKIGDTLRRAHCPPLQIRAALQILEATESPGFPPDLEIERINFGPPFRIGSADFFIQFTDDGKALSGKLYSGSGRLCPRRLRWFTEVVTELISHAVRAPGENLRSLAPLLSGENLFKESQGKG